MEAGTKGGAGPPSLVPARVGGGTTPPNNCWRRSRACAAVAGESDARRGRGPRRRATDAQVRPAPGSWAASAGAVGVLGHAVPLGDPAAAGRAGGAVRRPGACGAGSASTRRTAPAPHGAGPGRPHAADARGLGSWRRGRCAGPVGGPGGGRERRPGARPRERAGRSHPVGRRPGGSHTLVVGATGSGKTVTEAWIAGRRSNPGTAPSWSTPRATRPARAARARPRAAGRRFLEWTPSGPCAYNPYARGSETEIADKALAGERFTEPHYLRQAQRYLGHAVRALQAGAIGVTPTRARGAPATRVSWRRSRASLRVGRHALSQLPGVADRTPARDLAGVRDRLAILAESDVGPWLDPRTPAPAIDLPAVRGSARSSTSPGRRPSAAARPDARPPRSCRTCRPSPPPAGTRRRRRSS